MVGLGLVSGCFRVGLAGEGWSWFRVTRASPLRRGRFLRGQPGSISLLVSREVHRKPRVGGGEGGVGVGGVGGWVGWGG